ncbi:MAG TPA: hypothetical protein VEL07_15945 [Planctomycetota bacterium]|nr:hypothetical protein [Planctomycetota bacterium]
MTLILIGAISFWCSRGRDGQLYNGVGLLAALSCLRAVMELGWFRTGGISLYIAMLIASPIVAYASMLPRSTLEEMGGMLFLYFPVAAVAGDVVMLLPNLILRWKRTAS